MISKKIDLGEYIVTIYHDEIKEILEVKVLDELGDIIEAIVITSDDGDDDIDEPMDFNLN